MMSKTNNKELGIALVKELCPICCKEMDGPILIGTKFDSHVKEINDMTGKVIGFSKEPCEECKKHIDEGVFFVIGVDLAKSDKTNYYRTGHVVGIKNTCELVSTIKQTLPKVKSACFMDIHDMIQMNLVKEENEC